MRWQFAQTKVSLGNFTIDLRQDRSHMERGIGFILPASGIEARRAETQRGSVYESLAPKADAEPAAVNIIGLGRCGKLQ